MVVSISANSFSRQIQTVIWSARLQMSTVQVAPFEVCPLYPYKPDMHHKSGVFLYIRGKGPDGSIGNYVTYNVHGRTIFVVLLYMWWYCRVIL